MKLIVHELTASGLVQEMIPDRNLILGAVRPHIVRYGRPSGALKVQVLDASNTVISESEAVNISDIGTEEYFHGYVKFGTSVGLTKNETYKFKVIGASGYAFSESAFIGVCNDYDLRKYDATYTTNEGLHAPLDMEIWALSPR